VSFGSIVSVLVRDVPHHRQLSVVAFRIAWYRRR